MAVRSRRNGTAVLLILAAAIWIVGCSAPAEVGREPIGAILSADVPPLAWHTPQITLVRTERAFVTVDCVVGYVMLGREAYIVTRDNGRRYLWWQGADREYPLRRNGR